MSDFVERVRALDAAATEGPWGVEGSRFGPSHDRNGQTWGLNWRRDQEFIASARSMLPAAVEALARVRGLHRKFGLYELEDSCTNTSEEHREERHHESSDDVGEFYCEDMPIGAVCDECRNEDGERLEWPCATYAAYQATEVEA